MGLLLLDTDVTSFLLKGSSYAAPYRSILLNHELALSFMTVAELYQWAMIRQWGDRRMAALENYLTRYVVIPVDEPLCRQWAQVRTEQRHQGITLSAQDAWIAATALRYDLSLVTHNVRDYQTISGLKLLSPTGE